MLGNSSIKTTMIYTHVNPKATKRINSPLDNLPPHSIPIKKIEKKWFKLWFISKTILYLTDEKSIKIPYQKPPNPYEKSSFKYSKKHNQSLGKYYKQSFIH